jgi:eukaryotic-like serine/threonine-protein kinase
VALWTQSSQRIFRFGAFEVDLWTGELRKDGTKLKVQDQPLKVLAILLARPGELVTREELRQGLWSNDTFVDFDSGLNAAVKRLRAVLNDSAETPLFVETVGRRGYRFIAPVAIKSSAKEETTAPRLTSSSRVCESSPTGHFAASISTEEAEQTSFPQRSKQAVETLWTRHKKLWQVLAPVLTVICAALIAPGIYHRSHSRKQINHKDTIVLADFANTTGDTVFDGTLRQGLSVQLEQSPFLRIISDQQVQQTLAMMGQPADAKLTSTIARELCKRTSSAALVDGSIAQIGTQYVLTLKAADCSSGESLASSQTQARDKNHVLAGLGQAALDLRQKLGESLSTTQQFDIPLERATTPSLEALQSYSFGRRQMDPNGDNFAAVPLFQRAIQLDPNFAMAYASLGTTYFNLGEHKLGGDNTRKAYELRERLSQRERFYIEAHYYDQVTGDLEKARQVYDLWARIFPNDFVPHDNLAEIYAQLGQYNRSLEEDGMAHRLDPANGELYADLAINYLYLNRLGEVETTIDQALANKLDSPELHIRLYELAFLRNDTAGMLRQVSWSAGEHGVEDVLLALEAETAAYGGRVTKARELSRRAIVSAQNAGEKETAATYEVFAALRESLMGNRLEARGFVADALRLSTGREVQAVAALALAFSGDIPRSQTLANDLAQNFPEDTIVQFNYVPTIRAQLAMDGGDARTAIATSEIAAAYELGDPVAGDVTAAMYPIFVRGQAYLMAGDGFKSVTEFQKVLDHPGVALNRPIGVLAHLGLARAYRLQGDTPRARSAYQDFLTLWKDADAGIPVMKQATAEYNNLK